MGDSGECEKRTIGDVVPYDPYQKPEVSGFPTFKVRIKSRLNLPHRRLNSQNVKALLNKKRKGIALPFLRNRAMPFENHFTAFYLPAF